MLWLLLGLFMLLKAGSHDQISGRRRALAWGCADHQEGDYSSCPTSCICSPQGRSRSQRRLRRHYRRGAYVTALLRTSCAERFDFDLNNLPRTMSLAAHTPCGGSSSLQEHPFQPPSLSRPTGC